MISEYSSQTENAFKQLPYYKAIVKSFLRKQIQNLLEELSEQTGEESIILTVNVDNGTLSHQGSSTAKGFLENRNDIKSDFLSYCISCNAEQFHKDLGKSRHSKTKRSSFPVDDQIRAPFHQPFSGLASGESTLYTPVDRETRVCKLETMSSKDPSTPAATSQDQDSVGSNSDQTDLSNGSGTKGTGSATTANQDVVVKREYGTEEDQDSEHSREPATEGGDLDMPWGQDQSGFGPMGSNKKLPPGSKDKDQNARRSFLSLKDRVEIIKDFESARNVSQRYLASKYNVGKSTVRGILSKKDLYMSQYEIDAGSKKKRFNSSTRYGEINERVYQWYSNMLVSGGKASGQVIQEKALEVAKSLDLPDFKASNGWLHSWKARYNILASAKPTIETSSESSSITASLCSGEDSILVDKPLEADIDLLMANENLDVNELSYGNFVPQDSIKKSEPQETIKESDASEALS